MCNLKSESQMGCEMSKMMGVASEVLSPGLGGGGGG